MADDSNNSRKRMNGTYVIGSVLTVAALAIASVAAVVAPINRDIDNQIRQISEIRGSLKEIRTELMDTIEHHEAVGGHNGMVRKTATMQESFRKVEVQITNAEKELDLARAWRIEHDQRVIGLNAAQWERIKALEREVFGMPFPVTSGKAAGSN